MEYLKRNKILVYVVVLVLLGGGLYLLWRESPLEIDSVYCTQEAMLCPDGSYVGRTGPNCEFAICPGVNSSTIGGSLWELYADVDSGFSFEYPKKLTTKYIIPVDWPPRVAVSDGPFACVEAGNEMERAGETKQRMVDDRTYCVTKESEGAAGSIYTNYAYATLKNQKVLIFTFSLRAVQCANYDQAEKTECENERTSFDLDGVIDRIAQSAVIE